MVLAFDTYYINDHAKTVCLAFEGWRHNDTWTVYTELLTGITAYVPGEFYKRELPCILSLYNKLPPAEIEAIIVDGFVYLDDDKKPGLGAHLYKALGEKIPVIGVAKTNFAGIEKDKLPVLRGDSVKPLYITAAGIDTALAAGYIKDMKGDFRIPTLLKALDGLTKNSVATYKINRYSLDKNFIAEGLLKVINNGPGTILLYKDFKIEVSANDAHHPLMALSRLRDELEFKYASLINCSGCRLDTSYRPTGGYEAYILHAGKPAFEHDHVNTFEPTAEIDKLGTVKQHEDAYEFWCKSFGER